MFVFLFFVVVFFVLFCFVLFLFHDKIWEISILLHTDATRRLTSFWLLVSQRFSRCIFDPSPDDCNCHSWKFRNVLLVKSTRVDCSHSSVHAKRISLIS